MADFYGAFRCGRRPDVTLRRYEPRDDGFLLEGAHDGYAHLPGRPIHIRRFDVSPGAVTIEDRLQGFTERASRIGFLLHPDVAVANDGDVLRLLRDDARVEMTASAPLIIEDAAWWPDMGVEQMTRRIVVTPAQGADSRVELRFSAGIGTPS
ncbi:hypothetical protein A8B73_00485 [Methylosinus sp. 3S-1]|nr:hypothetical protein A8B73_00485 [Methylosinus sp. 3S-1]